MYSWNNIYTINVFFYEKRAMRNIEIDMINFKLAGSSQANLEYSNYSLNN